MTRQRALILDILQSSRGHLTADEIFALARQTMPHIARGTVYRNLGLMEQSGEIGRLEMPEGPDCYDRTASPHGHLFCDGCGLLQDLMLPDFAEKLEPVVGSEVRGYQLTIHYLCPACRRKEAQ